MNPDDLAELQRLHRVFDVRRFTLAQIHRAAFQATSHYAQPHEEAEYRELLQRLAGFVAPCAGPRGGEGWALTDRGLRYCERQLERATNNLIPARAAGPNPGAPDATHHTDPH